MDFALNHSIIADDLQPRSSSFLNPFFLSKYKVPLAYDVLKWGAILVVSVAFFATLIPRLRFLVIKRNSPILQPLLGNFVDFDDFSDDDASSEVSSSSDYDYPSEEGAEEIDFSSSYQWGQEFKVSSSGLRRRRSFAENLSQLYNGRSVVKLWDNIGSKFRLISLADCANVDSPVIRLTPPGIIVSAGLDHVRNIALDAWDAGIGFRVPAILAEWSPEAYGGVEVAGDGRRPLSDNEWEDGGTLTALRITESLGIEFGKLMFLIIIIIRLLTVIHNEFGGVLFMIVNTIQRCKLSILDSHLFLYYVNRTSSNKLSILCREHTDCV